MQGGKWLMMSWQDLSPQQAVQKPRRTSVPSSTSGGKSREVGFQLFLPAVLGSRKQLAALPYVFSNPKVTILSRLRWRASIVPLAVVYSTSSLTQAGAPVGFCGDATFPAHLHLQQIPGPGRQVPNLKESSPSRHVLELGISPGHSAMLLICWSCLY